MWVTATDRSEFTLQQRARVRAAAVWATERAAAIVESAYRAGGGTSLYDSSPLQRRLRDINAVTQHFLVKPDTLTTAGAIFAGQEMTCPSSESATEGAPVAPDQATTSDQLFVGSPACRSSAGGSHDRV